VCRHSLLIALALLLAPASALAATTTWNFAGEKKIDGWNYGGLTTMQLQPEGLLIRTETAGQLVKVADIGHSVTTITVSYTALNPSDGIFLWKPKGASLNQVYQLPVSFEAGHRKLVLDMQRIQEWDATSDRIGLGFNPGTNLILEKIELGSPTLTARIIYGAKAFWTFDELRPYSINFLWGPLLATSEEQVANMYNALPPGAPSANAFLYGVIGLALLTYLILKRFRGKYATMTRRAFTVFVCVTAGIWMIYDLRMGLEFVSYASKDWKTWWSQPLELQDFRDRGSFNAFLNKVQPLIKDEKAFVFVASHGWPYSGQMRYSAYPARPLPSDDPETPGATLWVVYGRQDIVLKDKKLTVDSVPVTPEGEMLLEFEPGAFVFRIDQLASKP